jgi:hypothetical protein
MGMKASGKEGITFFMNPEKYENKRLDIIKDVTSIPKPFAVFFK